MSRIRFRHLIVLVPALDGLIVLPEGRVIVCVWNDSMLAFRTLPARYLASVLSGGKERRYATMASTSSSVMVA